MEMIPDAVAPAFHGGPVCRVAIPSSSASVSATRSRPLGPARVAPWMAPFLLRNGPPCALRWPALRTPSASCGCTRRWGAMCWWPKPSMASSRSTAWVSSGRSPPCRWMPACHWRR
ncbi:hypothetical protein G6F65_021199 [Rhizopus arrhizus]|nr:hypothetical protein G6F65_021199 [Rhizopus arrhizus]